MKIILTILLFIPIVSFSQNDTIYPFNPDRPGITSSPYVVGINQYGLESGIGLNYSGSNFYFTTNSLRYGLSKHFEIFTEYDYGFTLDSNIYHGIDALTLGLKIPFIYKNKYFPDMALSGSFSTNYTINLDLFIQKNIKKLSIICNFGMGWDTINTHVKGMYGLCVSYYLTKKLSTFVETYGYYNDIIQPTSGGDYGFEYDVTSELSLDISSEVDYVKWFKNYFIGCGVSWRIPKHHEKHLN